MIFVHKIILNQFYRLRWVLFTTLLTNGWVCRSIVPLKLVCNRPAEGPVWDTLLFWMSWWVSCSMRRRRLILLLKDRVRFPSSGHNTFRCLTTVDINLKTMLGEMDTDSLYMVLGGEWEKVVSPKLRKHTLDAGPSAFPGKRVWFSPTITCETVLLALGGFRSGVAWRPPRRRVRTSYNWSWQEEYKGEGSGSAQLKNALLLAKWRRWSNGVGGRVV